jgi:hypothetical protein
MTCCGGKRRAAAAAWTPAEPQGGAGLSRAVLPSASVELQYTGATALTAVGSATGRRYRFPAAGAVLAVDRRDAASLVALPQLRRAAAG